MGVAPAGMPMVLAQTPAPSPQTAPDPSAGSEVWETLISFGRGAASVWNFQIAEVDGSAITVGKILTAILLMVVGMFLSRRITRSVGKRVLARMRLSEGGRNALESLLFYVLVTVFVLIALQVAQVPLTAFTILGGALAIGVGFGSQNLVNNFISGLILLVERPVRASDLIQIGDLHGTVTHIGPRSTRVLTGDNFDIIVPNSTFLQENVVNLTLGDSRARVSVAVGFAYGSPTREVRELLKRAVLEHGRVLKSPDPIVLFANFGDSSLEFEVHFWIEMRSTMDRRMVTSDLRFRIESLCREAGIVIAFPQRDVHLDTTRPLEVSLQQPGEPSSPAPETEALALP